MEKTYNLNELAMMSGFTTRSLRSYIKQGLLKGEKVNGTWQFSDEEVEHFFSEPYVKEGLRIKRNAIVYDFLADMNIKTNRACVILDMPVSDEKGMEASAFFCDQMAQAKDVVFSYIRDRGISRMILSGSKDQVKDLMDHYYFNQ